MKKIPNLLAGLTAILMTSLGGCGGGSGGGPVASSPPPPPLQPPPANAGTTDRIIAGATISQTFASRGAYSGGDSGLLFSYNSVTRTYSVAPPATAPDRTVDRATNYQPLPGDPWKAFTAAFDNNLNFQFQIRASADDPASAYRYTYSNLAAWTFMQGGKPWLGPAATAFGIATPGATVPRTGTGTYSGFLEGYVSETYFDGLAAAQLPGFVTGTLNLSFDFSAGSMGGIMDAKLGLSQPYTLGTIQFVNATWGVGYPQFSGALTGQSISNGQFDGLFTGPAAQELIGGFNFNYLSPVNGSEQSAEGAFIAKRGP